MIKNIEAITKQFTKIAACAFLFFLLFPLIAANGAPPVRFGGPEISFASPAAGDAGERLKDERVRIRAKSIERESLQKALREKTSFWIHNAEIDLLARDLTAAEKSVRQALVLDPLNKDAISLLSRIIKARREGAAPAVGSAWEGEASPGLTDAQREKLVAGFFKRAEELLKDGSYDEAVEELEKIFALEPFNEKASRRIDTIKKRFIKEKKKEWRRKVVKYDREFRERLDTSLTVIRQLIEQKEYMEAKIMLNRLAFVDPENKKIRGLMEKVQKEEKKAKGAEPAA